MSRGSLITLLVLILLIGGAVALFMTLSEHSVRTGGSSASTTPALTGQALFSDGEYGFTVRYPEHYQTDYTFSSFYHLPANWSALALTEATGTPIIAIIGMRTQAEHSYPRYFDAEVRIGASKDPKEVATCTASRSDAGETPLPDVSLGGTTFKAFAFESAGMMQYLKGISYRTVHDGACFAIERLETGASYRDDPKSPADIPDATLQRAYESLDAVVQTFSFTQP